MRAVSRAGLLRAEPAKVPFALRMECRRRGRARNQDSIPVSRKAGPYEIIKFLKLMAASLGPSGTAGHGTAWDSSRHSRTYDCSCRG
jgi:hypothetical protein